MSNHDLNAEVGLKVTGLSGSWPHVQLLDKASSAQLEKQATAVCPNRVHTTKGKSRTHDSSSQPIAARHAQTSPAIKPNTKAVDEKAEHRVSFIYGKSLEWVAKKGCVAVQKLSFVQLRISELLPPMLRDSTVPRGISALKAPSYEKADTKVRASKAMDLSLVHDMRPTDESKTKKGNCCPPNEKESGSLLADPGTLVAGERQPPGGSRDTPLQWGLSMSHLPCLQSWLWCLLLAALFVGGAAATPNHLSPSNEGIQTTLLALVTYALGPILGSVLETGTVGLAFETCFQKRQSTLPVYGISLGGIALSTFGLGDSALDAK
jgi:hypothetical protein